MVSSMAASIVSRVGVEVAAVVDRRRSRPRPRRRRVDGAIGLRLRVAEPPERGPRPRPLASAWLRSRRAPRPRLDGPRRSASARARRSVTRPPARIGGSRAESRGGSTVSSTVSPVGWIGRLRGAMLLLGGRPRNLSPSASTRLAVAIARSRGYRRRPLAACRSRRSSRLDVLEVGGSGISAIAAKRAGSSSASQLAEVRAISRSMALTSSLRTPLDLAARSRAACASTSCSRCRPWRVETCRRSPRGSGRSRPSTRFGSPRCRRRPAARARVLGIGGVGMSSRNALASASNCVTFVGPGRASGRVCGIADLVGGRRGTSSAAPGRRGWQGCLRHVLGVRMRSVVPCRSGSFGGPAERGLVAGSAPVPHRALGGVGRRPGVLRRPRASPRRSVRGHRFVGAPRGPEAGLGRRRRRRRGEPLRRVERAGERSGPGPWGDAYGVSVATVELSPLGGGTKAVPEAGGPGAPRLA